MDLLPFLATKGGLTRGGVTYHEINVTRILRPYFAIQVTIFQDKYSL